MEVEQKYQVVFFAGGETRDDKFNIFTGTFINFLSTLLDGNFRLIKGIYSRFPMFNVAWALNHAQTPLSNPGKCRITSNAIQQLIPDESGCDTTLLILSSSAGSIVAAQTACFLVNENIIHNYYKNAIHLVLGTNFISKESALFRKLIEYQSDGKIGTILFDELQDEDDSIYQAGGIKKAEAWKNALGLILPWFSKKYRAPSFLNTHPAKGHLHRRRSQTVKKAKDFIEVIFIKYNLAGDYYRERALDLLSGKLLNHLNSIG